MATATPSSQPAIHEAIAQAVRIGGEQRTDEGGSDVDIDVDRNSGEAASRAAWTSPMPAPALPKPRLG